jgi:hypothetical protein
VRFSLLGLAIVALFFGCQSKARTGDVATTRLGAAFDTALDDSDRSSLQQQSPKTLRKIDHREQLSTADVKKMSQAGLSNTAIINQIQATSSIFYLSTADIIDLKNSGVSQRVINYMIQTGNH